MTVAEAFEKYKHMDEVLSDLRFVESAEFIRVICYDLWQAVKTEVARASAVPSEPRYPPRYPPMSEAIRSKRIRNRKKVNTK